jgi:hypothetical protein
MLYHVSRNGQNYGPYTLEDLQRYVASGNVLPTDLAKSDEMADWIPVSQVLGASMPAAPAPVVAYGAPVPAYPAATAIYPDPPNLHWALVLVIGMFTCGIFSIVWMFVQASWMRKVNPNSKALFYYIAAFVVYAIAIVAEVDMMIAGRNGTPRRWHLGAVRHVRARVLRPVPLRLLQHAEFHGRALQRPRADRPLAQRCHDLLLQHPVLPVPLHAHQRTEARRALPGRGDLMRAAHSQWQRPVDSRADAVLKRRRFLAHLLLGSALLLCALLLIYPPTRTGFYPTCPIHQFLGIDCPRMRRHPRPRRSAARPPCGSSTPQRALRAAAARCADGRAGKLSPSHPAGRLSLAATACAPPSTPRSLQPLSSPSSAT